MIEEFHASINHRFFQPPRAEGFVTLLTLNPATGEGSSDGDQPQKPMPRSLEDRLQRAGLLDAAGVTDRRRVWLRHGPDPAISAHGPLQLLFPNISWCLAFETAATATPKANATAPSARNSLIGRRRHRHQPPSLLPFLPPGCLLKA